MSPDFSTKKRLLISSLKETQDFIGSDIITAENCITFGATFYASLEELASPCF